MPNAPCEAASMAKGGPGRYNRCVPHAAHAPAGRRWSRLPAAAWLLGGVSLCMDLSSEWINALLPLLLAAQPVATDSYLPALPAIARDLGSATTSLTAFVLAFGAAQLLLFRKRNDP